MKEGIFLEKEKIELFKKYGRSGFIAMELYVFYLFESLEQKTKQIKVSQEEVQKALNWGRDKAFKSRKILIDLGLIKTFLEKDSSGKFSGSFVKIL